MQNGIKRAGKFSPLTKAKPYLEFILNYLFNVVCLPAKIRRFRPMITNFYLTKRCNLRCRYCYPVGDEPDSALDLDLSLLEKIRPHSPAINFTGGEPLLYKDLIHLLRKAKELGFFPIILSTNGVLADRIIPQAFLVDHLIISLHSLSESVNDAVLGVPGVTQVIVKNIKQCASLSLLSGFQLSLHSVISPETLDGIEDVAHFCQSLGVTWSVSPEHGRYYPHPELVQNQKYTRLIDRLTELKAKTQAIACSYEYLRKIRNFSEHRCYPFISPRVEPDGRVYFPCQRIKQRHVFLQDYKGLIQLMRQEAHWTADRDCGHRCFLACYVEVEQYIRNPLMILGEAQIQRLVFGRK